MNAYRIRPATERDLEVVLYHRRRMFEDIGFTDPQGQAAMHAIVAPMIERGLADGNYRGWLAESAAGEVVAGGGVIFLSFHCNPGDPRPQRAWVVNLFTEPGHRRQGLARQLMEAILAWCRAEDLRNLYLHASVEGRALYESLGFKPNNEMRLMLKPGVRKHALQRVDSATASTGMLIRRPVAEVFTAFIDPAVTTQFWFTKSSGRLEVGKPVTWEWEMYGVAVPVTVRTIEPNARIVIEWPGDGGLTTVDWTFAPRADGTTFVGIAEAGFAERGEELVRRVADSTEGFTLVLAGLKALLEHGVRLNLVADRFPKAQ